jgi:hypothetical protein
MKITYGSPTPQKPCLRFFLHATNADEVRFLTILRDHLESKDGARLKFDEAEIAESGGKALPNRPAKSISLTLDDPSYTVPGTPAHQAKSMEVTEEPKVQNASAERKERIRQLRGY